LKKNRWQYTKESFLFSFGNRGNIDDAKLSKIQPGNEAIYDDPSFGPCFGKTDLDMRRQFNEKDNCSAKKRSYKHTIINSTEFVVDDYEVFQ
ncbi:23671_t:CDS:1, partial [Racocetra persica]